MILPESVGLYRFSIDEELFGSLEPLHPSWFGWNTLFKVYDRLPLTKQEQQFFGKVTGGLSYHPKKELPNNWLMIVGRGGGKSRSVSRISLYRAFTFNKPLHPGQKAENIIVSPSLSAGMIPFEYMEGMLEENDELYSELVTEGNKLIIKNSQMARMSFSNHTIIRLSAVTRIAGRGRSVWTLILEEAAHFKTEGRFSDEEVFKSANPGRGRFGLDSMCFAITSAYTKEGLVWKVYDEFYGKKNDHWLVIAGSTAQFNPTYATEPEKIAFLNLEEERDPDYFKREYMSQFTDAETGAIPGQVVADCIIRGRKELSYSSTEDYFGYLDVAGLSPNDKYRFADDWVAGVGHVDRERGRIMQDCIRGWAAKMEGRRVSPQDALNETFNLFKSYRVRHVRGDKKLGYWWEPEFKKQGFVFEPSPISTSDLYLELIPAMNNREIELLDNDKQNDQLKGLERKRGNSGRDRIEHPPEKHDDYATVVAGLAFMGKERMAKAPVSIDQVKFGGIREASGEFGRVGTASDEFGDML